MISRTGGCRPATAWPKFSLLTLLAVTVGLGLLLAALVPMLAALVVSSRMIDDGVQPGESAVIDQWDAWAFSAKNCGLVVAGLLLVALGAVHFFRQVVRTTNH